MGRAGSQADQHPAPLADVTDRVFLLGGGDRPFHQGEVKLAFERPSRRLAEEGNLHPVGDSEQFVLAVQQRELAAIARGELEDAQPGPRLLARGRR